MAGKPRKAPNAIAGHRTKQPITSAPAAGLSVVPASAPAETERVVPPVPPGMLKRSREIWTRYWSCDLSDHVDREGGLYRVERWIRHVDELERAWRVYRTERFVTGSMGQVRLNPAWKTILDCEAFVAKAEEQLGMTPLARARLGLTLGAEATTLADLNRRMNEPDEARGARLVNPKTIEGEWSPL